jgi:hypothetical protein
MEREAPVMPDTLLALLLRPETTEMSSVTGIMPLVKASKASD